MGALRDTIKTIKTLAQQQVLSRGVTSYDSPVNRTPPVNGRLEGARAEGRGPTQTRLDVIEGQLVTVRMLSKS